MKLSATLKTARAMRDFVLGATAAALAKRANCGVAAPLKSLVAAGHALAVETTELRSYTHPETGEESCGHVSVTVYKLTPKGVAWFKAEWRACGAERIHGAA